MRPKSTRLAIACILIILILAGAGKLFLDSKYVIPILMYHAVDEKAAETKLSVRPESFRRQMRFLHDRGYNVITLKELTDAMKNKVPFPPKSVAITFDDGYENNYSNAFPVVKEYNIPITIFVAVSNIEKEGYLSWEQVKEMVESGLVSIGSHTFNHAYLPSVSDRGRLRLEIFKSKHLLQILTGQKDIFFSYPVGGFNENIRTMVAEAGYSGACATNPGKHYPKDDIYALKRVRISRTSDNLFVFWIESSGYYTFVKEVRDED